MTCSSSFPARVMQRGIMAGHTVIGVILLWLPHFLQIGRFYLNEDRVWQTTAPPHGFIPFRKVQLYFLLTFDRPYFRSHRYQHYKLLGGKDLNETLPVTKAVGGLWPKYPSLVHTLVVFHQTCNRGYLAVVSFRMKIGAYSFTALSK
jgi:hypothetical protein